MKSFFMHYGMIIVAGSLTVLGLMFSTPFAEAVTGSVANFTTGFTKKNVENIDRVTIGLGNGGAGGSEGSGGSGGSTVSVVKGQIVTMSDLGLTDVDANADSTADTFRVLSVDGTNIKLLAMDSYKSVYFNTAGTNTYAGSTLDTEMTNYYNALPVDVKTAIVAQNIVQSIYLRSYPISTTNRTGQNDVGERYVYALDVDDVISYLGDSYTASPCIALNQMFFGDDAGEKAFDSVWLRSAYAGTATKVFDVYGFGGDVSVDSVCYDGYFEVRPAFVLDLG